MQKSFSAILFSFLIFNFSFLIVFAQTNPLVESGKAKQKEGSHEGAINDFTSAIKQHESEVQKYLIKFEEYYKISAFDRAEKGIESPPVDVNFSIPYYLRGYSYSATGKNNFIEMVAWKIPKSKFYPEGIKYSFTFVHDDKRAIAFDNFNNEGHHKHHLNKSKTPDKL